MIAEVTKETGAKFHHLLAQNPLQGCRLGALFACYAPFPALCRFFFVGENAALAVLGPAALLAGEVPPEAGEELAAFLQFLGVKRVEGGSLSAPLPGYITAELALMVRGRGPAGVPAEGQFACTPEQAQKPPWPPLYTEEETPLGILKTPGGQTLRLAENPPPLAVFALLCEEGLFEKGGQNGFYADICARRLRGLCSVFALYSGGQMVATAGVYARGFETGHVACVAVAKPWQGQGLAAFLLQAVNRRCGENETLTLTCKAGLCPLYEKAGYVKTGTLFCAEAVGNIE